MFITCVILIYGSIWFLSNVTLHDTLDNTNFLLYYKYNFFLLSEPKIEILIDILFSQWDK